MKFDTVHVTWEARHQDGRRITATRDYTLFSEKTDDEAIKKFVTERVAKQVKIPKHSITIVSIERD